MEQLNVKPVLDRLIIKQSEGKKDVAGMIIPESERQKPLRGVVVAAGPGFRNSKGEIVPMTAKVGDEVAYVEHSVTKIEIDGVDYIYIKEGDLILIY
jgi:chaperonin GroES